MTVHKIILSPYTQDRAFFQYGEHFHGDSREPLFAAARELLVRGLADPEDVIETWWRGSDTWAMRAKVGYAAGRTILEMKSGGIRMVKHTDKGEVFAAG